MDIERKTGNGAYIEMEEKEKVMISAADKVLLTKKKHKNVNKQAMIEPVWMTREIREEIKRKEYNRRKRTGGAGEFWKLYREQKRRVRDLVYQEKSRFELQICREIKNSREGGTKMWSHIRKLQGKNGNAAMVRIYEDRSKIDVEKEAGKMMEYWGKLLGGMENNLNGWEREQQIEEKEDVLMVFVNVLSSQRIPAHLRKHYDACRRKI